MRQARPRLALPGSIAAGADDLSVHFEGLANPTRLAVVELLASRNEIRVTELAEACRISQPRMSWHLRILRQAGIIATRREGREVFCRLDRDTIAVWMRKYVVLLSGSESRVIADALAPVTKPTTTAISEGAV